MALESNTAGDSPKVASTAFVHPAATVIGNVLIEDRVFIGPHAVLRADETGTDGAVKPIVVSEGANVQDCAVVHALGGTGVTIGPGSSIAHAAVVHGPCQIGADCFVGFGSVVFDATLGDSVVMMHNALVEGVTMPSGLHVPSMAAIRCEADVGTLARATPEQVAFAKGVSRTNALLAKAALEGKANK